MSKEIQLNIGDADALRTTVSNMLNNLGIRVEDQFQEAADEIGKEAVKKLKAKNFGRHKWKNYPKGWKYKAGKFVSGNFESKIYNSTHGWLTHLLEHGHPIITKSGEKVGDAAAFPHIAPVQEWINQELPRRIAEKMRKTN